MLRLSRTLKHALVLSLAAWLGGCANFSYYAQAVGGQLDILRRTQPISEITADPSADQKLKHTLAKIVQLREFASRELQLPDNQSYLSYADLERPYVVWNVFATPELSIEPKQSCFVGAGCVTYRGFFSQAEAEGHAQALQAEGYDVYVGGVPAYSTLGWFNDPVLNTFVRYSETELARLIFHELAHQVVYVSDDTTFNESFATAVELEGVGRWLASHGTAEQRAALDAAQSRRAAFSETVRTKRKQLEDLFASSVNDAEKRAGKARIFAELRAELSQLKTASTGKSALDQWLAQQLNNAHLASFSTYTQLVPAFRALLTQQQGDMGRFYAAVKEMSSLPAAERAVVLQTPIENVAQR
ncbi:MAG: aminopeptidase [Burkholderiales bacterium]|nr:aminopeptidase [Burkholderiales bacterium]